MPDPIPLHRGVRIVRPAPPEIERPEPIDLEDWFLSRQRNAPSHRGERITAWAAFIIVGLTLGYFAFRLFGPLF